jgi:hypothetical protein
LDQSQGRASGSISNGNVTIHSCVNQTSADEVNCIRAEYTYTYDITVIQGDVTQYQAMSIKLPLPQGQISIEIGANIQEVHTITI